MNKTRALCALFALCHALAGAPALLEDFEAPLTVAGRLAALVRSTPDAESVPLNLVLNHSRAMNSAASERPSEKSSRSINRSRSASFHGTGSSGSGSSPTSFCGYRSRASTTWVWWLM